MRPRIRQGIIVTVVAIAIVFILRMYTNNLDTTSLFFAYARWTQERQGSTSVGFLNSDKYRSQHDLAFQDNKHKLGSSSAITISNTSQGHLNDSLATRVTFDPDLIVHCKVSPYTNCTAPHHIPGKNHTFRVVLLRRPSWFAVQTLDFSTCEYNKCIGAWGSQNGISKETDAVVVYADSLNSQFRPPTRRWPHQLYGVYTVEPPYFTFADFLKTKSSVWNYLFNFTVTYRLNSEVSVHYGFLYFQPIPLEKRPNYYEIAKSKNKTAAWFVSKCHPPSKRNEYVKEMQKYIDVTIYGKCGIPCPRDENERCMKELQTDYKFYLSFENSLCPDYISEKMFKIYRQGLHVIPVVRGGADYDKYFPNFTFINAAHFKTAKDLALHLKDLASDLETYSKYLEYIDMY